MSRIDFSDCVVVGGWFARSPRRRWRYRVIRIHGFHRLGSILRRINLHLGCCDLKTHTHTKYGYSRTGNPVYKWQKYLLEAASVRYDCRVGDSVYPLVSSSEKASSNLGSDCDNPIPLFCLRSMDTTKKKVNKNN